MADRVPKLPAKFKSIERPGLADELSVGAGRPITVGDIDRVIAEGAAANADGSIDLTPFAAWLVKETPRAP